MDHRVTAVATLFVATACVGGCSQAVGKTELTDVCLDKFGGKAEMCDCLINSIESSLDEQQFAELSKAVYDNRRFAGDWIPASIRSQPKFRMPLGDANSACFSPA